MRNRIASFAERMTSRSAAISRPSDVRENHTVTSAPPTVKVWGVSLAATSPGGNPAGSSAGGDADFSSSHCCRYNAATPVWSMSSALLIWVHNPVVLQLVLPVQSARGPPVSDRTTNLLWPSPLDLSSRSIVGTPLSFKCWRAAAFPSPDLSDPLARMRCRCAATAISASSSFSSPSSYKAAWSSAWPPWASVKIAPSLAPRSPSRKARNFGSTLFLSWALKLAGVSFLAFRYRATNCERARPRLKKHEKPPPASGESFAQRVHGLAGPFVYGRPLPSSIIAVTR